MTSVVSLDRSDSLSEDPAVAFNFSLEVQGQIAGFFTEISGLGSETEVAEHLVVTPSGQQVVKKVPGRLKWSDISLKRGITSDMMLWDWRQMVENGDVDGSRRNGSIVMYDQAQQPVARWNFEKGWPSKIDGPAPKADSSDLAIEEMTIVHEYIARVTV